MLHDNPAVTQIQCRESIFCQQDASTRFISVTAQRNLSFHNSDLYLLKSSILFDVKFSSKYLYAGILYLNHKRTAHIMRHLKIGLPLQPDMSAGNRIGIRDFQNRVTVEPNPGPITQGDSPLLILIRIDSMIGWLPACRLY